ncbi:unnamed protein product [Linum tenue]|uniref:Uncharacterized protein n=1 Tax=Linum tenue TaxID=586396 RepID=A0AAV0MUU3_9ROSI|nr:unnamed protein product [Linum tenue]
MEEEGSADFSGGPPLVSLSSFPPASRRCRLSSCCYNFAPVASCGTMAWLSLQGRMVNAEEASSSKSIGLLGKEEALAWELFTPMQRFLIVAVIGVAASESRKNRTISQLKKSVELRDELLSGMQQKLDSLCLQMASINVDGNKDDGEEEFLSSMGFVDCGCWHCDQHHQELFGGGTLGLKGGKARGGDEVVELKRPLLDQDEQEERRMSDLSDWASSSASGSEFQISNFMVDQDTCNLKKICEEKDATIKELKDVLQLTDKAGSKRISELEDIICRKNAMITRLKKDMVVLEQKVVVQLTRVRRKSTSHLAPEFEQSSPFMVDNIVYDMDSLTSSSSSSSDSDSPTTHRLIPPPQTTCQKSAPGRVSSTPPAMARSVSPLRELSMNQKYGRPSSSKSKQLSANGDIKKTRRRPPTQAASNSIQKKRWS